ncbi:hypothetical protein D3C71_2056760 [compost metagenome]
MHYLRLWKEGFIVLVLAEGSLIRDFRLRLLETYQNPVIIEVMVTFGEGFKGERDDRGLEFI